MASQAPDIKSAIHTSGETILERAAKKQQVDKLLHVSLNIAVTGELGVGKSTFINAIRELGDDDEGAAKTGVTETTPEPTPYPHPTLPNVTLWDLPGVGALNISAKAYPQAMHFDKYDLFIIISSERFKENDILLAKEINKLNKKFYFIRSKIDNDIRSEEHKRNFNKEKPLSKIRSDCLESLKEFVNPKVFLISSMDLFAFDFEELVDTLVLEMPEHKRYALLQSVPVTSLAMLKKKVQMFQKLAWAAAVCSGAVAAATVPGLSLACNVSILLGFFTGSYYSFGLHDKSLEKLSKRVNKAQIKSMTKFHLVQAMTSTSAKRLQLLALAGSVAVELLCSSGPGVGNVLAATLSFSFTYKILQSGLKEIGHITEKVLREAGLE